MKKLLFIAMLSILALNACKKDEENRPANEAEVTIDGTKSKFIDLVYITLTNGENVYYTISNTNIEDKNNINISMKNPTVGTLSFGTYNSIGIGVGSKSYYSTSGSFTITEVNSSVISGSFSGTFIEGTNQIQISGSFSAKLN
jgi:hypothetical protein